MRLGPSFRQYLLQPKPKLPPGAHLSSDEGSHLDYFRLVCTRSLSRYFRDTFWERTILQISNTEPAIRSAIVAFARLLRHQTVYGHEWSAKTNKDPAINADYAQALQGINQRLDTSESSWELALVGSLIFTALEVLRGDAEIALKHFEAGIAMLKEFQFKFQVRISVTPSKSTLC